MQMKAVNLKTEFMTDPVGIGASRPLLLWNCEGGINQTAFEITARDDGGILLWESGKLSSSSMRVRWGGAPVPSGTRVYWSIRLWDENDACGESAGAYFETGISFQDACWITGNYKVNRLRRYPVDCFRKTFRAEKISKARLYVTACGLYEARLNGERCGNIVMAPGHTDYRKRVQYQTVDVTALIKEGENSLTIQLADGWYRGSCGAWGRKNQYGTETKLLARLELILADGGVKSLVTDGSWEWSSDGPLLFADNKDGERVDARLVPSYSGRARVTRHNVTPTPSDNVPVTEHEHFSPSLIKTPSGQSVLDFGQNIAGFAAFSLKAHAGDKITLFFGEMLNSSGEFTQENFQMGSGDRLTPKQRVDYICREGQNDYKTSFAVFGFRYALVEADFPIDPACFEAIAVYSDLKQTGFFNCSHPLINGLFDATVWSAKGNHLDVPTDCPTRERHAWTGDAQIFCSTAAYLFDYRSFGDKYIRDLYDWQKPDGKLPQIAPDGGVDFYMKSMDGSIGWADAGIIIPYTLYRQYGDRDILYKFAPGMRRYAAFMQNRCGRFYPMAHNPGLTKEQLKHLSNCGQAYGEWAEPVDVHSMSWQDFSSPRPEEATAYTAYIMDLMAEIETELGCYENARSYTAFAEKCRESYQALMDTPEYPLDTDRQARLVRPLYFNLLTPEQKEYAEGRLLRALENYGWRLGTGFLSTPLILDVLAGIDPESAYKLLENEEIPGWLSMPKNGATTIWENWEGPYNTQGAGLGSLNHYSKGSVCRWFFDTMCGIRIGDENTFVIAPVPGGSLTFAEASYDSVYGRVESRWEKTACGIRYTITVPSNCRAFIRLPGRKEILQSPGTAVYE